MIWWIWTAYNPTKINIFNVNRAWWDDDPDVYWLGECAWTTRNDNIGIGLR